MTEPRQLSAGWRARCDSEGLEVALPVPGDVHSALLDAGVIVDPYWRDTEVSLDWIHQAEWTLFCTFQGGPVDGRPILTFEGIDGVAEVVLNGRSLGTADNAFRRWDFDVSRALAEGDNLLELRFASTSAEARRRAEASAIPTPYSQGNCRLPHYNYLRKVQCDAGWDWNIALSPLGLTGPVTLRDCPGHRLDEVSVRQRHEHGRVEIEVTAHITAWDDVTGDARLRVGDATVTHPYVLPPGEHRVTLHHTIPNPRLWWPAGHGPQEVYDLHLTLAGETREMTLGLRQVELLTDPDEIGHRFAFRINGREIFMKGANWIPADALPDRCTPDVVRDLLTSAVEANMNMIRVWGGGRYEPDWFYDLCTRLGLMVWQDFMFACNLYPAHDPAFLANVRHEARQQVRRLSRHACIALLCGDNELVGALTWYPESRKNRDRYLAIYDRLNRTLEEIVEDEATGLPWWPSSPSVGPLNFGDGWHDDTSGDMHFWDVWHSARDFEHYRTVKPRFCSEFGFQSFPSPRVIDSFTEKADRNVSSAVMDTHQRNAGGNARIVETIARYFRFPEGFEDLNYVSQLGQAFAMKTAVEFWRSRKPRCMGTLYWQLNDSWPVASWSSLEYGGGWKLTHYLARRFFAPVLLTAQPEGDDIVLFGINDGPAPATIATTLRSVRATEVAAIAGHEAVLPPGHATEITRLRPGTLPGDAFLHFDWTGDATGENEFLPKRPKQYPLPQPDIDVTRTGDTVTLTARAPALFVTWDFGGDTVWSDNCLTLLPGLPRTLTPVRTRRSHLPDRPAKLHAPRTG